MTNEGCDFNPIALVISFSCCGAREKSTMKNGDTDVNGFEGSPALQDALTKEYDLHELEEYFKNRNINENIVLNTTAPVLSYSEVDKKYPVEVTRAEGYSVYRVSQGGYFYVFWTEAQGEYMGTENENMYVYFSSYLTSPVNQNDFSILRFGESTAADVKKIDPNMELCFLLSNGTFSYSYLDDTTILQVEYTHEGEINRYDDLIVKNVTVASKSSTPSRYNSILLGDLPWNTYPSPNE